MLPPNQNRLLDRYSVLIVNSINIKSESDAEEPEEEEDFDVVTDDTPFIGVASQSRSKSVIAYYGIENHSKWVFTPLFRGADRQN